MTLREWREGSYLSVRDLARRAGVAHTTVVYLEAGRRRAGWQTMRKLATALGIEPSQVTEFVRVRKEEEE